MKESSKMLINIFRKQLFNKPAVAAVNENLLYLYVSPLLGLYKNERHMSRWTVRRPSKEFPPDDNITAEKGDARELNKEELIKSSPQYTNKDIKKNQTHAVKPVHSFENNEYMVLDENDYTFSNLMIQVGSRNNRRKSRLMMLEGKRLNHDALLAGFQPVKLFFTQKSYLSELNFPEDLNSPLFKIPYKTMKLWSKLEAPPGIIGFFKIPKEGDIKAVNTLPVRVLCDNVRDPGNLGSILRVAASVGCTEVLLTKGCTDPWDSKVLRSASGGHFHIPIRMDLNWEEHKDFIQPTDHIFLADNNYDGKLPPQQNLPQMMYHELDYVSLKSIVMIIGGETEGVSGEACSLASTHDGSRVYIPLSNSMESLNSGCALSILLFEIKRQFLMNSLLDSSNKSRSKDFG